MRDLPTQTKELEKILSLHKREIITTNEAVTHVLDEMVDSTDRDELWQLLPVHFRNEIIDHIRLIGPENVQQAMCLGYPDPNWLESQTTKRRAIAAELINMHA